MKSNLERDLNSGKIKFQQSSLRVQQSNPLTSRHDENRLGRSMIEMPGVLAIIAVLSVGGIAGYSKAMEMFKLNRWKENIVTLTSNLKIMYMNEKSYTNTDNQMMMNLYKDIGIIPQNMLNAQNKDAFGNSWQIYSFTPPNSQITVSRLFLRFWTLPDTNAVKTCKEMFYLQSEYEDSWAVVLNEGITGRSGGILTVCGKSAPDYYAKEMHCEPFDLAVIAAKCGVCSKQKCDLIMVLANGR